jgi:hypothetical protein
MIKTRLKLNSTDSSVCPLPGTIIADGSVSEDSVDGVTLVESVDTV